MPPTRRMRALERAALPHGRPGCHQVTLSEVEEAKALLGLGPLFLCTCVWQVGARGARARRGALSARARVFCEAELHV